MSRPDGSAPKRKNARMDFRYLTDAEAVGVDLERSIKALQAIAAKLVPQHEEECAARAVDNANTGEVDGIIPSTLDALGRVKGRMYLERVARGLSAKDISPGSGWTEHTLRQFENREADAMVSSLFRYASGLRAAGIPGHIEIRWVPDEQAPAAHRDCDDTCGHCNLFPAPTDPTIPEVRLDDAA